MATHTKRKPIPAAEQEILKKHMLNTAMALVGSVQTEEFQSYLSDKKHPDNIVVGAFLVAAGILVGFGSARPIDEAIADTHTSVDILTRAGLVLGRGLRTRGLDS